LVAPNSFFLGPILGTGGCCGGLMPPSLNKSKDSNNFWPFKIPKPFFTNGIFLAAVNASSAYLRALGPYFADAPKTFPPNGIVPIVSTANCFAVSLLGLSLKFFLEQFS